MSVTGNENSEACLVVLIASSAKGAALISAVKKRVLFLRGGTILPSAKRQCTSARA